MDGTCDKRAEYCWFNHEEANDENIPMDTSLNEEAHNEQDFHKAQESHPPDQMSILMKIIRTISIQVDLLEKNQKNQFQK